MCSNLEEETKEEYLPLARGETYIKWNNASCGSNGAKSKPATILLLHGATVPQWQFDRIVPHLVGSKGRTDSRCGGGNATATGSEYSCGGYRTLRIDLYGHGDSAIPNTTDTSYTIDLFIDQVLETLAKLRERGDLRDDEPLIGLGHSLGSAVLAGVASVAALHAAGDGTTATTASCRLAFAKLMLVAPMLDYKALNPHARLLSIPVLGEILVDCGVVPHLRKRRRKRYGAIGCAHLGEKFVEQSLRPGFARALLSMFRDGCVDDQSAIYKGLATRMEQEGNSGLKMQVKVIWGSNDAVVSEEQIARIIHLVGGKSRDNAGTGNIAGKATVCARRSTCSDCSEEDEVGVRIPLENSTSDITWERMDGMEHNLLLSHPAECAKSILSFIGGFP